MSLRSPVIFSRLVFRRLVCLHLVLCLGDTGDRRIRAVQFFDLFTKASQIVERTMRNRLLFRDRLADIHRSLKRGALEQGRTGHQGLGGIFRRDIVSAAAGVAGGADSVFGVSVSAMSFSSPSGLRDHTGRNTRRGYIIIARDSLAILSSLTSPATPRLRLSQHLPDGPGQGPSGSDETGGRGNQHRCRQPRKHRRNRGAKIDDTRDGGQRREIAQHQG
jgi:hypothetical protein